MLICTALGKLLRLDSNSLRAVRAIQVPTSNFHSPPSLSHKLSSTQCIIFPEKICLEHQASSPSVQISRADLTHPLFFLFPFHPDLYCLLYNLFSCTAQDQAMYMYNVRARDKKRKCFYLHLSLFLTVPFAPSFWRYCSIKFK